MSLYLDSADADDARQAQKWDFIEGITTNPTLIARTGRAPFDVLTDLVEIIEGNVFYQLTGQSAEEREDEAWEAYRIRPDRVVLMIPAMMENFALVATLSKEIECAMTAIYDPAQAYLAAQAGAHYAIPYVNRATQQLGDGLALLRTIRELLEGTGVEILAADITSPEEAIDTLRAGADHLTVPLDIIRAMGTHPLSRQNIAEFAAALEANSNTE